MRNIAQTMMILIMRNKKSRRLTVSIFVLYSKRWLMPPLLEFPQQQASPLLSPLLPQP